MNDNTKRDTKRGVDSDTAGVGEAVFGDDRKVRARGHDGEEADHYDGEEFGEVRHRK